ncbi:SLX4 endonuclease, partial [Casuarius casuarius]|nr:SLX4 endonuclease [Casuarius casuarius]
QERDKPPETPMTPMPAYSTMETPEPKKELSRFGVCPLPKREMLLRLKEFFQYIRRDRDAALEDEIPSSHPPLQKSPTKRSRQEQKRSTVSPERGSLAADDEELMLSASRESSTSSLDGSDISSELQSSFANEFEACGVVSEEEEEEELPPSQAAAQEADKLEAVRNYIRSNPDLYHKILFYEPLDLAVLHSELKQKGIKIAKANLQDFLDAQCITFTTAAARKEK